MSAAAGIVVVALFVLAGIGCWVEAGKTIRRYRVYESGFFPVLYIPFILIVGLILFGAALTVLEIILGIIPTAH